MKIALFSLDRTSKQARMLIRYSSAVKVYIFFLKCAHFTVLTSKMGKSHRNQHHKKNIDFSLGMLLLRKWRQQLLLSLSLAAYSAYHQKLFHIFIFIGILSRISLSLRLAQHQHHHHLSYSRAGLRVYARSVIRVSLLTECERGMGILQKLIKSKIY